MSAPSPYNAAIEQIREGLRALGDATGMSFGELEINFPIDSRKGTHISWLKEPAPNLRHITINIGLPK